jgi:hypothetical protein
MFPMIPMPEALRRRSSWPSSFVTALIGWNGFATVGALAFGRGALLPALLPIVSVCAVVQVLALRALFGVARSSGGLAAGAVVGAVTALLMMPAVMALIPDLGRHPIVTLAIAGYIGAPVGIFLAYFRRDDARIEAAARDGVVDYGRDAHWLDPFIYGALAYLVVYLPTAPWSALTIAVVGAMVGVVAAGVSHFFLARFDNAPITIPIAAVAGAPLGAATGWLLRAAARAPVASLVSGVLAGGLCFAVTAAVGRRLAAREGARIR